MQSTLLQKAKQSLNLTATHKEIIKTMYRILTTRTYAVSTDYNIRADLEDNGVKVEEVRRRVNELEHAGYITSCYSPFGGTAKIRQLTQLGLATANILVKGGVNEQQSVKN